MKSLLHRLAWASAGVAVACGLASRAAANDAPSPLPPPDSCAPARVVCPQAPKVIVEVPPPNVIIRATAAPCAPAQRESLLQKICHFGCQPHHHHPHHHHVQQAFIQPMAVQPMAVQQYVQPMAVQQYVQPMAVQQYVQPMAVQQHFVQPMAVQPMAVQHFVQPQAVQPQAVQHYVLQPVASPVQPQAVPPAAVPPVAPTGETCDAALRRVTNQMETLTKVVEAHTQVLISHEQRIKALEDWANAVKDAPAAAVNPSFPRYVAPPKQ